MSKLRITRIFSRISRSHSHVEAVLSGLLISSLIGVVLYFARIHFFNASEVWDFVIFMLALGMSAQGCMTIFWMIYGWEDPEKIAENASPDIYEDPYFSFTAIIPAKEEEEVIGPTLRSISRIHYPPSLKEIIVVCHEDDGATISKVRETIEKLQDPTIKLVTFSSATTSKPHALNLALPHATKNVIAVFDAEDRPNQYIYHIVNTVLLTKRVDVVQSGVQLMNFTASWFALFTVLEYFFWFKSTLHFFASQQIIPLAGNTVFFKKKWLTKINGWDESCLTEDADIGIRLSLSGAKTKVVYDERHITKEEVPTTLMHFIKQRTRWNQGFIQILQKGEWSKLPKLSQKLLAVYILLVPELQALSFLLMPFSLFSLLEIKLPVPLALFAIIPLMIIFVQQTILIIGIYEFTSHYKLRWSFLLPLKILFFFFPFQLVLGMSALRACVRTVTANKTWEKTYHANAHDIQIQHPTYTTALS